MRPYKYKFLILLAIIASSFVLTFVSAVLDAGFRTMLIISLAGLGALCAMVFYACSALTSLDGVIDTLKKAPLAGVKSNAFSIAVPIADAITQCSEELSKKNVELEQQNSDMTVKLGILQRQKNNTDQIIYSISDSVIVTDAFDVWS